MKKEYILQRTLLIIKPDAVKKKVIGKIISMVEKEFAIRGICMKTLTPEEAKKFYKVHEGKDFYEGLVEFMSSSPSVGVLLEGENAIYRLREIVGATDPKKAKPGTIRSLFGTNIRFNAVHASDSPEAAKYEIPFYFPNWDA